MSGKRQHFVPRFLSSGFACERNGNNIFTWCYRKGQEPFRPNIINVGAEGYFYSEQDDRRLDTEITETEGSMSQLVERLRHESVQALDDSTAIAQLIAHLEVRSRNVRQGISAATLSIVERTLKSFGDPQFVESNFVKQQIEELQKEIPGLGESQIRYLISSGPSLRGTVNKYFAEFECSIHDLSKKSHNKTLMRSHIPSEKVDRYRTLKFHLVRRNGDSSPLPLGDSMVVFHVDGPRAFKPFLDKADSIRAVYLPVSADLLLVGSLGGGAPELMVISMAIAQCATEYFITNSRCERNEKLQLRIGEFSHLLSDDQISSVVADGLNE